MTTRQTTNPLLTWPAQPDSEERIAAVSPTGSGQPTSLGRRITRLAHLAANEHVRQVNQVNHMNQVNQGQLDACEGVRQ